MEGNQDGRCFAGIFVFNFASGTTVQLVQVRHFLFISRLNILELNIFLNV